MLEIYFKNNLGQGRSGWSYRCTNMTMTYQLLRMANGWMGNLCKHICICICLKVKEKKDMAEENRCNYIRKKL